jgi:hypothetical protein
MQKITGITILLLIMGIPAVVFALGTENFGDRPIEVSSEWPDGMKKMLDGPGLVYSRWVNGGEYFCYKGDISAFNEVLKKFADINTPRHLLIIDSNCGQAVSFHGKVINFDWRFDFCGGISRPALLWMGATEADLIPELSYCLCREKSNLDKLIVPENVEILILDSDRSDFLVYRLKQASKWRTAENKWLEFVDHFPEKLGYVEFQSQPASKYLPGYQLYLLEINTALPKLFAVSVDGNIFDLKGNQFSRVSGNAPFKNELFSNFIAEQQIKVDDINTAVEVVKFIEDIAFASERWKYMRRNSKEFKIFKAWVFSKSGTIDNENWQWLADKQANGWFVSRKYVGPRASIMMLPKWNLICDDQRRIVEVVHY